VITFHCSRAGQREQSRGGRLNTKTVLICDLLHFSLDNKLHVAWVVK